MNLRLIQYMSLVFSRHVLWTGILHDNWICHEIFIGIGIEITFL